MVTKQILDITDKALPWHQHLVMRVFFGPMVASASDPKESRQVYQTFSEKIVELVTEVPVDSQTTPVLVPRQVGLLETSRYWSIT